MVPVWNNKASAKEDTASSNLSPAILTDALATIPPSERTAISVVPPSQGYSTIGAYSITNVEDKDGYYHVIDARGAKVFSYKKNEYKEIHLTTHGYLIIKKQNDT